MGVAVMSFGCVVGCVVCACVCVRCVCVCVAVGEGVNVDDVWLSW